MSENARDQQSFEDDEQEQKRPPHEDMLGVSQAWLNFSKTFEHMQESFKPTQRGTINKDDIKAFIKDLESFDNYIQKMKSDDSNFALPINIDELEKHNNKIIIAVDALSKAKSRYDESGWNIQQLGDNDIVYAKRLSKCYNLLRQLRSEFFVAKS